MTWDRCLGVEGTATVLLTNNVNLNLARVGDGMPSQLSQMRKFRFPDIRSVTKIAWPVEEGQDCPTWKPPTPVGLTLNAL